MKVVAVVAVDSNSNDSVIIATGTVLIIFQRRYDTGTIGFLDFKLSESRGI